MNKSSIIGICILSFFSCNNLEEGQFENIADFHSSQLQPEIFVSSVEDDIDIVGQHGTRLRIPVKGMQSKDELIGNVTIQFKELFKKSDLVLNNIPTNTVQEEWLESGGTFFFHISDDNGNTVIVNELIELQFPISESISDTSNMSVWSGVNESGLFNFEDGAAPFGTWRDVSSGNPSNNVRTNTASNQFTMYSLGFNWINCDYVFETDLELTSVRAKIDNTDIDPLNINTFIVLKNINAVLRLRQLDDFYESFQIPIGEDAFVVSIGVKRDVYAAIEPFKIKKNQLLELNLEQVKEKKLKEMMSILDE